MRKKGLSNLNKSIIRKVLFVLRTEGIFSLISRTIRRYRLNREDGNPGLSHKKDVIGFYKFVLEPDAGSLDELPSEIFHKTINWFIPDFGIGSGGHLNIFRYINFLENLGYTNTIYIVGNHRHRSAQHAEKLICKNFFDLKAKVVFNAEDLPTATFSFATSWITAYALRGFGNTAHKLYFVQDYEPYFYPHGSEYSFAEETYRFGFTGVCAGNWLAEKLTNDFGMTCHSLGFSFDVDLYKKTQRREPEIIQVFCYCRPPTARRGIEAALLALSIVGDKIPNAKFIFAGWDMSEYHFPYPHLNAGTLSLEALPDLYSQCDVGLVLSSTNLSLLPLELMSCGCVVVSNKGPNTEWLLGDSNCVLVDYVPEKMADGIIEVLENDDKRANLASAAKEFSASTSWEFEARRLDEILSKKF
jgi:O-antigen biosynthesis protein